MNPDKKTARVAGFLCVLVGITAAVGSAVPDRPNPAHYEAQEQERPPTGASAARVLALEQTFDPERTPNASDMGYAPPEFIVDERTGDVRGIRRELGGDLSPADEAAGRAYSNAAAGRLKEVFDASLGKVGEAVEGIGYVTRGALGVAGTSLFTTDTRFDDLVGQIAQRSGRPRTDLALQLAAGNVLWEEQTKGPGRSDRCEPDQGRDGS